MASVAIDTAVSKPKVCSVHGMSLSMVLGTPTTGTRPSVWARCAVASEPSPPMTTRASSPSSPRVDRARSTPSSVSHGWTLEVPSMVPPRAR